MPAEEDWQDAKSLEPKFLSNDIFDKRWRALIEEGENLTKDNQNNIEWKVVDAVQEDLLGTGVYEENKRWNKGSSNACSYGHIKILNCKTEIDGPVDLAIYFSSRFILNHVSMHQTNWCLFKRRTSPMTKIDRF